MNIKRTAGVVVAGALLVTLGGVGGAVATTIITSANIKDHTIRAIDMKKGAIRSKQIKDGTVRKQDLATGVGTATAMSSVSSTGGNVTLPDVTCPARSWALQIGQEGQFYVFEDDIVSTNTPQNPGNGTVTATPVTDHFNNIIGFRQISVTQSSGSDKHTYTFRVLCG